MSKAPKNIEKIVLGVALLIAAGLVALGFMKKGKVADEFSDTPPQSGSDETSIDEAEEVPRAINSLASDRELEAETIPMPSVEGGERVVNLFVGVPLFANRDNPNEPVDLLRSPPVHEPIPNVWWLKYNVSPNFANSPQRDADGDGFSNLEEYEGETDPSDPRAHPPLIAKLSYARDESVQWLVEFGIESQGKWFPKYVDDQGNEIRVGLGDGGIAPDELFFDEDPVKDRFKFLGFEDRQELNERLNIQENRRYALYEDQKPNKKGDQYEIRRIPQALKDEFSHYDRTAVLELQALGLAGQEFEVEERTAFSLPPGEEEKNHFLKEVTPEQVVVERTVDGEAESYTIPRGGLPQLPTR